MKFSFYSAGFLLIAAVTALPVPAEEKDKPCPPGKIRVINPTTHAWVCGVGRKATEHTADSINAHHELALGHHAAGTHAQAPGKTYPDPLHNPGESIHHSLGGHGEVQHYPLKNPKNPIGPPVYNGGKPDTKDRIAYTVDHEKKESKFLGVVTHNGAETGGKLILGNEKTTPPGSPKI